jgi:outer membrane lipoprotein SlyB
MIRSVPRLPTFALAALLPLAACAPSQTGETYNRDQIGRTAIVTQGTIIGMRDVTLQGSPGGVGTTAGAIGGGVAGSFIGGDWRSNVLAGLAGAIIGGLAGSQVERQVSRGKATEFTIRETDGTTIAVVQTNEAGLAVGDKVRILRSDRTRLARDTAGEV